MRLRWMETESEHHVFFIASITAHNTSLTIDKIDNNTVTGLGFNNTYNI